MKKSFLSEQREGGKKNERNKKKQGEHEKQAENRFCHLTLLSQFFEWYAKTHEEDNALEIVRIQIDFDEETLMEILGQKRFTRIHDNIAKAASRPSEHS